MTVRYSTVKLDLVQDILLALRERKPARDLNDLCKRVLQIGRNHYPDRTVQEIRYTVMDVAFSLGIIVEED